MNELLNVLRTLSPARRRVEIRAHLEATEGINFNLDPHCLTISQQCALAKVAKSINWRKSISASCSVGTAFYIHLARDAS